MKMTRTERQSRHPAPLLAALLLLASGLLLAATPATAREQQQQQGQTPAAPPSPQTPAPAKPADMAAAAGKTTPVTAASTGAELARAAYESLGGDKFRDLKNMVLTGALDLYSPGSVQSLAGTFGVITAGERVRQEMRSPFFNVSAIYDGVRSYSSIRSFQLPPPSKFGLLVLLKSAQPGYSVAALPEKDKKKERAFRVTDAEGNATDFYVELATGRLARYEIPFGDVTYIVDIKSYKTLEGVSVPWNFVQKLATPQGSFIAEFKVKEAKLNQELPADAFAIPDK
jgi:hypothetical protein